MCFNLQTRTLLEYLDQQMALMGKSTAPEKWEISQRFKNVDRENSKGNVKIGLKMHMSIIEVKEKV